jgi:hypothetical protein
VSNQVEFRGIGIGAVIAAVISYSVNKSILWAFLHGAFGWLYIFYALMTGQVEC